MLGTLSATRTGTRNGNRQGSLIGTRSGFRRTPSTSTTQSSPGFSVATPIIGSGFGATIAGASGSGYSVTTSIISGGLGAGSATRTGYSIATPMVSGGMGDAESVISLDGFSIAIPITANYGTAFTGSVRDGFSAETPIIIGGLGAASISVTRDAFGVTVPIFSGGYGVRAYSTAAQTAINQLINGSYGESDLDAIAVMVDNLVAAGLWADVLLFYMVAAPVEGDAYRDWTGNGFHGTKNGSGGFTANFGLNPGASNAIYVATGFTPSTDLPSLNAFTAGFWSNTNNQNGGYVEFGGSDGSGNWLYLQGRDATDVLYYGTNNTALESISSVTDCSGLIMIGRDGANSTFAYRNKTTLGTGTSSSTAKPSIEMHFAGYNENGSNNYAPSRQLSMFFIAEDAWDTSQRDDFYDAVQPYIAYRNGL